MDDLTPPKYCPAFQHAQLQEVRDELTRFYSTALPVDAELMSVLLIAHVALVVTMNAPRACLPPKLRHWLERSSDTVDQLFAELRERVRVCPTFASLTAAERAQIEHVVFEVRPS
jgi:hypothetical protein